MNCVKCNCEILDFKSNKRMYCIKCKDENNRVRTKERYRELTSRVDCNCIICGVDLVRTTRVAPTAKCHKCVSKLFREANLPTVIKPNNLSYSYDSYDIPSSNYIVRC